MSIKDEIREDQDGQALRQSGRSRCSTCKAIAELSDRDRLEMIGEIIPDQSFKNAPVARWLSAKTSIVVGKESVATHREKHRA